MDCQSRKTKVKHKYWINGLSIEQNESKTQVLDQWAVNRHFFETWILFENYTFLTQSSLHSEIQQGGGDGYFRAPVGKNKGV